MKRLPSYAPEFGNLPGASSYSLGSQDLVLDSLPAPSTPATDEPSSHDAPPMTVQAVFADAEQPTSEFSTSGVDNVSATTDALKNLLDPSIGSAVEFGAKDEGMPPPSVTPEWSPVVLSTPLGMSPALFVSQNSPNPAGASTGPSWSESVAVFAASIGAQNQGTTHETPSLEVFHAAPHAAEDFDHGAGVAEGVAASAPYMPEITNLASLVNPQPHSDGGSTTSSAVGPYGATGAQVQAALDESGLSVNGSGITVGVLSDSFNNLGGAAADEADGALPPGADINVIKDLASGDGTDEGRAMMQIIHDVAPGANLAFYTAFASEQDFANGILALAAAGCKVIVDDVSYYDEPFFQNGVVAQAIQTVEAEGVTYVTAAGNNGSAAYQAAWTPYREAIYDGIELTHTERFAGGSPVQTVTVDGEVPLLVEWNEPYGGQRTTKMEMLVFQYGNLVGLIDSKYEGEKHNPWMGVELYYGTYQIAIERASGPRPGLIKEIAAGDGIPAEISGANVGTVFGHAMTPGAISAGAVSAAETPAFGAAPPQSEYFSSDGTGTELLFANNGTRLSPPEHLSPVAVSGVDDIQTTVPYLSDFYGTSAASASLAGVAALLLSANPDLSPAQVEQIMEQTASHMANPAVSGAGLVQVDPAVALAETTVGLDSINQSNAVSNSISSASPGPAAVDASATQSLADGNFLFKDLDAGAMPTVKVVPDKGGVGYIGTLTAEAGEFSNGHLSVHWQFDTDGAAVAETVTQSYDVTLSTVAKSETRAISVTIGGPGSDTFVFAPGFGTDVIANAATSDKIELDGFASVTSVHELHELLSEARAGQSDSLFHAAQGGDDTVIHLGHHDNIILANVHLADLHVHNFIIR